jgi:lysophospholipase L1-like esterase
MSHTTVSLNYADDATRGLQSVRWRTPQPKPLRPGRYRSALLAAFLLGNGGLVGPAHAANVLLALGDSFTFGETDLIYVPSLGDRGYVARFADAMAAGNGGARPEVINLAIDGETASSFMTGSGRTPPVAGRKDAPLALQNLNYREADLLPQGRLFARTVAAQAARGNAIKAVTMSLGFNELGALAALPSAMALAKIPQVLADYRSSFSAVLGEVRGALPDADLTLLGYYNPFAADPTNPAASIFNAGGAQLNATIKDLASQFGATFVDTAAAFAGQATDYTYLDESPAGSSVPGLYGGVLPIGNVHPNAEGYAVIGAQVAQSASTQSLPPSGLVSEVPETSIWAMFGSGFAAMGWLLFLRRNHANDRTVRQPSLF